MASYDLYKKCCSFALILTVAIGAFVARGCASTERTNLWVDPSFNGGPMAKVMVIAMSKDQLRRRMWEDAIVNELVGKNKTGTVGVASYQLFPSGIPDSVDARLKAEEEDFDGVLIVTRAQRKSQTTDVAGYTANEPVTRYSRRWRAYITNYETVYYPGYTETETIVSVRTDLLIPKEDGRLVWSVTSLEVDPASPDQFRKFVAEQVVSQLTKERFVF